jgi:hypothetical protein
MIRRFLLPVLFAYAVEAALLAILWFEVPFLAGIAGLLQVPSAAWALGVPPPDLAPHGKRDFFVFMFLVQGCIFSIVAFGIRALWRRRPN